MPSPTRFTALELPPEQHFGMVRTSHVLPHVPTMEQDCIPPTNPGPQVIYNGPRTPIVDGGGNPVLDTNGNSTFVPLPVLDRSTQAIIDTSFI